MPRKRLVSKPAGPVTPSSTSKNLLLAALPAAEYARLLPELKSVTLTPKLILLKRDQPITNVFFPEGGVCSLTTSMADGDSVEVATVGLEGVIGCEMLLGSELAATDAFVQVSPGDAKSLSAQAFRREMQAKGPLYQAVSRYSPALFAQIVQTAACNRLHSVEGRCGRWLLLTHDRVRADDFRLSHEFLAIMLGVQRSTVSIVMGSLQNSGLLRYVHGRVTIVDRAGLEHVCCECYGVLRPHFARAGLHPYRSH